MVNTHNPSTWEVQGHPQHIASSRQPWATGQLVTKGKEGEKEREWKGYRQKNKTVLWLWDRASPRSRLHLSGIFPGPDRRAL